MHPGRDCRNRASGSTLMSTPARVARHSSILAGRLVRVFREHRHDAAIVYAVFPNRRQIRRAVSVFAAAGGFGADHR